MPVNGMILSPVEVWARWGRMLLRAGNKAPIVSEVEREAQDGPGQVSPCTCQYVLLPSPPGKGDQRKPEGRLGWAWVTGRLKASSSP